MHIFFDDYNRDSYSFHWLLLVNNLCVFFSQIYPCELENVINFGGFREWLHSFELYRGKRTGDELEDQNRIVGIFKVNTEFYHCLYILGCTCTYPPSIFGEHCTLLHNGNLLFYCKRTHEPNEIFLAEIGVKRWNISYESSYCKKLRSFRRIL